jgi:hypothetical protein
MRDPTGKEERRCGTGQVVRLEVKRIRAEEIADMVKRHDNHHESAQRVNGANSGIHETVILRG